MLRADLIRNEAKEVACLSELLKKIKGTNYVNCYTPAPDTYRSLASMWTGRYPLSHGVNNRNYTVCGALKKGCNNWVQKALDKGYEFNCYCGPVSCEWPIDLPYLKGNSVHVVAGGFFDDYLSELTIRDNSITFLVFDDLHSALDDGAYTRKALKNGIDIIMENLSLFFAKWEIDFFDHIVFFSDHGYISSEESGGYYLDARRTNNFFFYHKKDDMTYMNSGKLVSIMDIYPTVLEWLDENDSGIDGISLSSEEEHAYLLFEDTETYYPTLLQPINKWAVLDNEGMYFIDEQLKWSNTPANGKYYIDLLRKKATNFELLFEISEKSLMPRKVVVPSEEYAKYYSNHKLRRRISKFGKLYLLILKKVRS